MTVQLPNFIPPQTAPIATDRNGQMLMDINWYLFFYNLANQVLSQNTATPVSPSQLLDMIDLDALGTDIPQAYVQNANNNIEVNQEEVTQADINVLKAKITATQLNDYEYNPYQLGSQTTDYLQFNPYFSYAPKIGKLGWNGGSTLNFGMTSQTVQSIGEDQFIYIKASAAITAGQVIMFTGAVGASGVLQGAPASGVIPSSYIMGVACENIPLNGFGVVQSFGLIQNLNTNAWAPGTVLYYDPTVTGGLTSTQPLAPNTKVQLAAVVNQGLGNGSIFVRRQETGNINNINQVQVTSPTANQVLAYNGTYWTNATNSATNVTVTLNSTDTTAYLAFVGTDTGNNPVLVNTGLTYNAVNNAITGGINGGSI